MVSGWSLSSVFVQNLEMEVTKIVTTSENVVIVQLVFNDGRQTIIVSIFVEHATTFYRDLCIGSTHLCWI